MISILLIIKYNSMKILKMLKIQIFERNNQVKLKNIGNKPL